MIYLVQGSRGRYSDTRWWVVRSFTLELDAIEYVEKLNKWYEDYITTYRELESKFWDNEEGAGEKWSKWEKEPCPLDPLFQENFSSIYPMDYFYTCVPLNNE